MRHLIRILLSAAIIAEICGCAPLVVGGAAAGASIAGDRRPAGTVVDDTFIALQSEAVISAHRTLRDNTHIDASSINGVVLLTGEARTPAELDRVLTLVSGVSGVRKIINQVRVGAPSSAGERLTDSYITLRVKMALVGHGLNADRIKVVTASHVVYLLGVVTPANGTKAAHVASQVPHVHSVVELFQNP